MANNYFRTVPDPMMVKAFGPDVDISEHGIANPEQLNTIAETLNSLLRPSATYTMSATAHHKGREVGKIGPTKSRVGIGDSVTITLPTVCVDNMPPDDKIRYRITVSCSAAQKEVVKEWAITVKELSESRNTHTQATIAEQAINKQMEELAMDGDQPVAKGVAAVSSVPLPQQALTTEQKKAKIATLETCIAGLAEMGERGASMRTTYENQIKTLRAGIDGDKAAQKRVRAEATAFTQRGDAQSEVMRGLRRAP